MRGSGGEFKLSVAWNGFDRSPISMDRKNFLNPRAVTYVTACFMEDLYREGTVDQDGTNENNADRAAVIKNRKERTGRFKVKHTVWEYMHMTNYTCW